ILCACRFDPLPDKSVSPLPVQTPLTPVPTRPASAPASPHQTPRSLPLAALATAPLPIYCWSPFPLIPPPPALPEQLHSAFALGCWRLDPAPPAASSAKNPAFPPPLHASDKTPAAATRSLQTRQPTARLPPAFAAVTPSPYLLFF